LAALLLVRVAGGPDADGVAASGEFVVDRLLGLRRAEVHDPAAGLEDGVELLDLFGELLAGTLSPGVVRDLDVVGDDEVGTVAR
jgi:hypothetical protein